MRKAQYQQVIKVHRIAVFRNCRECLFERQVPARVKRHQRQYQRRKANSRQRELPAHIEVARTQASVQIAQPKTYGRGKQQSILPDGRKPSPEIDEQKSRQHPHQEVVEAQMEGREIG